MNALIEKKLLNLIVALDVHDQHLRPMTPEDYQEAAIVTRILVKEQLGKVALRDFVGPVHSLQVTAENIFFEARGYLPDYDEKSGHFPVRRDIADSLFARLRNVAPAHI